MMMSRGSFTTPPPRRRRLVGLGAVGEAGDRRLERRLREHEPVVEQHVVGVELLRAARSARARRGCAATSTPLLRCGTARGARAACALALRRAGRAPRAACTPVLGLRLVDAPVVDDDDLALGRAVGERASAARAAPSSWACAASSRAAWGRAPHHRRATAATRIEPWRARPVPFWRHGLAPPPRTSARVLVLCVPARLAASCAVTTWCITATFGSMPKMSSGSSTLRRVGAVGLLHREEAHYAFTPAFTALRTNTRPPDGPGIEPLIEQQAALGVALDDLEVERRDPRVADTGRPSSCP